MIELSAANLASWMAQVLVIASVGSVLPLVFRIRHPKSQLLYCHALLAGCLVLPLAQPWRHPAALAPAAGMSYAGSASAPQIGGATAETRTAPPLRFPASLASRPLASLIGARLLLWILAAGAVGRLLWLVGGLWQIRRYRIAATPFYPIPESVKAAAALTGTDALFCVSLDASGPVSMGMLCPVVLLPDSFQQLGEEAQCGVACHELLHVRRNDWLIALMEEVAGSLFWFNPAVWWLLSQARLAREEIVDAEAVRLTAARESYIDALLAIARGRRILDLAPAPLFLRRRHLTHRLHLLLKEVSMSRFRLLTSYVSIAAVVAFAVWFALASFPLTARPQEKLVASAMAQTVPPGSPAPATAKAPDAVSRAATDGIVQQSPSAAPPPAPCEPQAYVPNLLPLFQATVSLPEPAYALFGDGGSFFSAVDVLLTIGPEGSVRGVETLSGLDALRQPAANAAWRYKYQPVIRNGQPVCALTSAIVTFHTPGKPLDPQAEAAGRTAAVERRQALEKQWPRTPEQVLADMEQDRAAPGGYARVLALPRLAVAALNAGALDKAVAYAKEAIGTGGGGGNYGEAVFYGNMVLGRVALRNGDVAEAKHYLIASGKTPGGPSLNSFGPNMSLAKELVERGERDAVLEFLSLCGTFWKTGNGKLEAWSAAVRSGGIPDFGANLNY